MNLESLASAFAELKRCPFPGPPEDLDLADWILDLLLVDTTLAGTVTSILGRGGRTPFQSSDVARLATELEEIRVVGDDELTYRECVDYINALKPVEDALNRLANAVR